VRRGFALALAALALALPGAAHAERRGIGPGRPIPAPPGRTDAELLAKAMRIEAGMDAHLSPEGILAYVHRVGADPARLSHDVLALSDAAMWTGCYAAAEACRYKVTRDPAALERCRTLARGLAFLTAASGRHGGLVRNAGRPLPGSPPAEKSEPSPIGQGYWVRGDPSRDQLAGVTLGWALLGRFVDDNAIYVLARDHVGAIARQLVRDNMWLRDLRGHKTEHGELRADVEQMPLLRNGRFAAIGLAPVAAARWLDRSDGEIDRAYRRLQKLGWGRALPEQFTWLRDLQTQSDVNMGSIALCTVFLMADQGESDAARSGLGRIRQATVGWWNGGVLACGLLGGLAKERGEVIDELRAVLHHMSEEEVPFAGTLERQERRIVTIWERGNSHWAWKDQLDLARYVPRGAGRTAETHTRADWLFAYWLARAAGALDPGTLVAGAPGAAGPPAAPPPVPPGAGPPGPVGAPR
jgi:hypothetical protein